MATTLLGENTVHTVGDLPGVGTKAPDFTLTSGDFTDVTKTAGKRTVLDIFPSIATGVCQAGVRKFNELAAGLDNTEIVAVSQDLPFALASFCAAEGLENVLVGSAFRSGFGTDYGVTMADGGWRGWRSWPGPGPALTAERRPARHWAWPPPSSASRPSTPSANCPRRAAPPPTSH